MTARTMVGIRVTDHLDSLSDQGRNRTADTRIFGPLSGGRETH
jgi:hypothetical protein